MGNEPVFQASDSAARGSSGGCKSVLITVALAAWSVAEEAPSWYLLGHVLFGTALVILGAIALNQLLEHNSDAEMARTASRPLRVCVARGSMPYSAVTQPRPDPRRNGGTRSSTLAVHRTMVWPNSTSTEPSAWRVN